MNKAARPAKSSVICPVRELLLATTVAGLLVAGGLGLFAWRRRERPAAAAFAGLMLADTVWLVTHGATLLADGPAAIGLAHRDANGPPVPGTGVSLGRSGVRGSEPPPYRPGGRGHDRTDGARRGRIRLVVLDRWRVGRRPPGRGRRRPVVAGRADAAGVGLRRVRLRGPRGELPRVGPVVPVDRARLPTTGRGVHGRGGRSDGREPRVRSDSGRSRRSTPRRTPSSCSAS